MTYVTTLREWQTSIKPINKLLYNCSEYSHKNDEWVPFPIGLQVYYIHYSGTLEQSQIGGHAKRVLCAINGNTDQRRRPNGVNRRSILKTLESASIYNQSVRSDEYFRIIPTYKFVISPEGNGIDCHRHYEALMAGSIPIVEDNELIRKKYGNCPILYTKDYSEITPEYLDRKYSEMLDAVWDFSSLFLDSYDQPVQDQIKSNGNYWGKTLTGKIWYATYLNNPA